MRRALGWGGGGGSGHPHSVPIPRPQLRIATWASAGRRSPARPPPARACVRARVLACACVQVAQDRVGLGFHGPQAFHGPGVCLCPGRFLRRRRLGFRSALSVSRSPSPSALSVSLSIDHTPLCTASTPPPPPLRTHSPTSSPGGHAYRRGASPHEQAARAQKARRPRHSRPANDGSRLASQAMCAGSSVSTL